MDVPLLITLLAVIGLGFVVLYSAVGGQTALLIRQGIRIFVALMAFVVVAQIQPRTLKLWTPWIFLVGVTLLVLVIVTGVVGQGAQRWLDLAYRYIFWGTDHWHPRCIQLSTGGFDLSISGAA